MSGRQGRWVIVSAAYMLTVACAPSTVSAQQRVSLQLKWHHQFQFAGYYAAVARGFYAAEGLDVTILEGGPTRPPVPAVLRGLAQFGVSDSDLVRARMAGQPVVVCAAVLQHSPYVILSRKDRNIRTPADLVGARVMLSDDQGAAQLRAMLIREGIDPRGVNIVPHTWNSDDVIEGSVDAMSAYAMVEPAAFRARGVEPAMLRTLDYGVDFYGDTLFTTTAEMRAHPGRVAAFRRASIKGWEYALMHPEELAEVILKLPGVPGRGVTREALLQEAREMKLFVLSDLVEIGHMNPGRWERIAATYVPVGMAPADYSLDGFVYDPDPPFNRTVVAWVVRLGIASLGLLALAVLWNVQIRGRVRAKTRELNAEVTIRKDSEAEVQRLATRLRGIINASPVPQALNDGQEKITFLNPAFTETFGYTLEDIPTLQEWWPMAYPDPEYRRWVAATWKAALEKAKREGSAFQPFEVNVRCKDGLVKTVLVNASAFDDGPDGIHLVVLYDITARKRAEEELQSTHARLREQASLLDQARDAILVRDLDHRITFWNKGAERLYGWTDSEAIGRNAIELLYADATTFHSAWERTLSAGEWIGEMRQIDRNGRPVICEGRWTLVPDAAGRPASVLCIHTDITERRKLEQQFLRAQRLESIGTLAGGIAHDLNNVLAPVILAADLLKMTVTDPEDRDLIATIATSAQRGANMVSQVLSFARGLEGVRVELQVRHLMDDIEKIARDTLPKNIEVRTAVAPDLKTVLGDPNQLHQVLLNLCVNARDAMPNGGEVTLTASNVDLDSAAAAMHIEASAGPYVSIEVRDTGTGMPPSVLERIFDPFFTTKDVGKGTGLGLSTSLAIVKSHGGFVRVSSEEGQGSVFAVYLPAGAGAGAADRVNEPAAPPRGHGETVLVVDDEIAIRLMVRQTLEAFGYRVVLACDGAEALTLYERHRSDIAVVLTDMMMPVMDGPTAIHSLMRMDPDVRIIAASGLSAAGGPEMPAVPGARHFLPKPYSAHSLLTIIERALLKE